MNKLIRYFIIALFLFASQYFFHSFKLVLLTSFFIGLILFGEEISIWIFMGIEIIVLFTLFLINGIHWVSVQQFAELFGNISIYLLMAIMIFVSTLSVGLLGRTGNLILQRIYKPKD